MDKLGSILFNIGKIIGFMAAKARLGFHVYYNDPYRAPNWDRNL